MQECEGALRTHGAIAIVVSRYHERITRRLLDGALATCREAGANEDKLHVYWVDGAFEVGVMTHLLAHTGHFAVLVALGAVIRGETPHFDYVAGEACAAIGRAATETGTPIGFGLLTCDDMAQAVERAGGSAGNKGAEAAAAALRMADLQHQILVDLDGRDCMLRVESKRRARALQMLYAMETQGHQRADDIMRGLARLTGPEPDLLDPARDMVDGILARAPELDDYAAAAAENWRLDRVATVERCILRIATWELLATTLPAPVIISEAVWLSQRFASPKAPPFINGVLDRVARDLGRL